MAAILIVEDEHALGSALALAVRRLGHLPTLAASGGAALDLTAKTRFEAIVLDIGLPDMSGLEVLNQLRNSGSKVPVLIITAHATLDHAIASQKLGVADYLIKPLDLRRFEQSISALVTKGVVIAEPAESTATTLIGAAPRMHEVFLGIARACTGDMPVLVHGPCGSGKTLAARVIHANGSRSGGPLRLVECGTIRGVEALHGLLADPRGTLVMEDLAGLDPAIQADLADLTTQAAATMPRLIATMNADPQQAVRDGSLRPDLYYALSSLTIAMPPLRERVGDIPALSRFFFGLRGDPSAPVEITAPALCAMQAYGWPGNVRELRHVLEHAQAMSRGGPLFPGHLPPHVAEALRLSDGKAVSGELDAVVARWLDSRLELSAEETWHYDALLDQVEAAMLRHLLARFDNRPTRLAAALRMNRATLRQKLRRAGLADSM
jgi:DNA-binding NtrC family response regulator